jgi:hypothetical protein
MEIKLTPSESERFFHNALCNGSQELAMYGIQLDFDTDEYQKAKETIRSEKGEDHIICREDIWLQILKNGGKLKFECSDWDDVEIELKDVHERVQKTQMNHLMDMINDRDDAITADCILQTVLYNEIVFG